MRRKDLRGAQVWIGAVLEMSSLMVWRLSGRKTERSCRLVMRRVLDGGVGCCSGGMLERSRRREVLEDLLEEREGIVGLVTGDSDAMLMCGVLIVIVL